MLDRLVDRLAKLGEAALERPPASPEEVERLLDEMPEAPEDPRSETAEYEALDEDRAFLVDRDFDDEPPAGEPGADEPAAGPGAEPGPEQDQRAPRT